MKIIKNENLIKRNEKIGGWALAGALILMGGGLYINFTGKIIENAQSLYKFLAAFVLGYILMLVGVYLGKRYGGLPRVDIKFDSALKGLPKDYAVYHFSTAVDHLLVGPAGIWVMLPYHQKGLVTYSKNRWRISNGGFSQAYMSVLGFEGIGRPDYDAEKGIGAIKKQLAKDMDVNEIPEINVVLIFTNEQMTVQADDAPVLTIRLKQLKDFLRQKAKEKPITSTQLAAVKAALPK